jgi:hypothetical protein
MNEHSQAQLVGVGDVSDIIWPTYKRQTAAEGGDVAATFQFGGDDAALEQWFYEYLGREFRELFGGQTAFLGRVHTMRLAYNRLALTVSLDWLFNRVACAYTSVLDGSTLYTEFFSDTASVARWGAREHIIRPSDNSVGLSEAAELAQDLLAEFARPQVSRGEVGRLEQAQLQVTVQGYGQALDNQLIREETEGQDDASAEVGVALEHAWLIEPGRIATNTRQVSIQFDWQSRLERIRWLAGRRDADGNRYVYGTVGSPSFDYQSADPTPRYLIWTKRQVVEHYTPGKDYVPAPLVRPGGYSLVADQHTRQAAGWNPALQWDASVVYDVNGATLRGGAWGVQERTAALQMALTAKRIS